MPRAVKTQGQSDADKGSQSAKRLKREDSPDVFIVVDSDDDNACVISTLLCRVSAPVANLTMSRPKKVPMQPLTHAVDSLGAPDW